ncbi:ImmA/IrrE family metallo-endopeptidase [bacterium]|nr:ImmA/IrrE family metallo-endopeptidase [bacterium]
MNLNTLAQNVRRARTSKKLSQKALAEAAGISLPSVKNLENQKCEPRMATVQSIAGALEVPLKDLFAPVRELKTVRFRSSRRMQTRENILADVSRWLEDFNALEGLLEARISFKLKGVRSRCSRVNLAESAHFCRKSLGRSETEPIHDACGLLEHAGIKVLPLSTASDGFFGLSLGEEDGGPAVVVNVYERISVERQIFSAAHELGHLVLHPNAYDVRQSEENEQEEAEANFFAGHFLMPESGFWKEWNEAAGLHGVDRVFKVKRIFRVSYKTVLARLLEHEIVDKSIWAKFNTAYQKRFRRKLPFKEEPMGLEPAEPFGIHRFDFYEDRFSRLTRRAVEEGKISLGRGAEILRIGVGEMRELLSSWEAIL